MELRSAFGDKDVLAAMNGRVGDRLEVLKESGSHVVAKDISSTRLMTDWLKPVNRTASARCRTS